MEMYTRGYEITPLDDPLIVHVNGIDYFLGRKSPNHRVLIWPYQRGDKDKFGLATLTKEKEEDPNEKRIGKVIYVGDNAFQPPYYMGPECYVGDWIPFARYQLNKWKHGIEAEFVDNKWKVKDSLTAKYVVIGALQPEFISMSYGPDIDPSLIDTSIQLSK